MASLTNLDQTASLILSLFETQLDEQGVALPKRRYVAPGSMIVWDGEQMTVALMAVAQGIVAHQEPISFIPSAVHYVASFSVNLVRKVAGMNTEGFAGVEVPTAEAMGADGATLMIDAAQLVLAAGAIHAQYLLTDPGQDYAVEGIQPLGPEGELAGTRLLISFSLS